jgi:hypothetical protein
MHTFSGKSVLGFLLILFNPAVITNKVGIDVFAVVSTNSMQLPQAYFALVEGFIINLVIFHPNEFTFWHPAK